jgi:VanZ family protein
MSFLRGQPRILRSVPLGLCLAAVGYLALKPSPDARSIPFLPLNWAQWLDRHDTFNNVAAFAVLAALVHWTLSGRRREPVRTLLQRMLWLEAIVVGLELAQLWLPARSCDWRDMLAGLGGIVLGSVGWMRFRLFDARKP